MTRVLLSFFVSGLLIVVGIYTAWVQSGNYALAGELDRLQLESEWHMRRASELREAIERFEFEAVVDETAPSNVDEGQMRGNEGEAAAEL